MSRLCIWKAPHSEPWGPLRELSSEVMPTPPDRPFASADTQFRRQGLGFRGVVTSWVPAGVCTPRTLAPVRSRHPTPRPPRVQSI